MKNLLILFLNEVMPLANVPGALYQGGIEENTGILQIEYQI